MQGSKGKQSCSRAAAQMLEYVSSIQDLQLSAAQVVGEMTASHLNRSSHQMALLKAQKRKSGHGGS